MTQVSWKRQLILAVFLFALGTAAYWLEFRHKPAKESAEEQAKKVLALKDAPIESIKIVSGKSFELRCLDFAAKLCKPGENSKWELLEPMKVKADDSNTNSLVSTLNNLTSTETIDLKDETPEKRAALLREYGLDPQALAAPGARRVEVKTGSGQVSVYLGDAHPIGESLFALRGEGGKLEENTVYLIPNYFKSSLEHDLTYWRDKKLLTVAAHEIESFQLKGPKATVSAERKDGLWTLKTAKGEQYPGDIENIDALLAAATYLNAKDFVSNVKADAKAKAALRGAKPFATLTLQKQKGKDEREAPAPLVLTVFEKKNPDKVYATVSALDPLFELEVSAKDRLNKELKDLRLVKLITSMERFTAKRLELAGKPMGEGPLVLKNTDGKWIIEADKKEVDAEKVQRVLDSLTGNRIKEFLSGSAIPSGEQDGLRLTIGDEKSDAKRQFVFWKAADKLYARDLQGRKGEAFLVDSTLKDQLPWNRDFFSKPEPVPAPAKK